VAVAGVKLAAAKPTISRIRRLTAELGIPTFIVMEQDFSHLTGRRVRIPAGATVSSMHGETIVTKRSQTVRIDHIIGGYDVRGYEPRKTQARWAGSGGYWRAVDADLVELID